MLQNILELSDDCNSLKVTVENFKSEEKDLHRLSFLFDAQTNKQTLFVSSTE